ncbi:UDP-N-acetylglucosamine 2-epimerase (non-hydrolyzing), partial [Bacillus anthracis]
IHLIEPLDVIDFHNVAARSYLMLTDSGGVQEEAPSLGVPVLVLRDTTERPEGIEAGTLKLAGTDEETIFSLADELLSDKEAH